MDLNDVSTYIAREVCGKKGWNSQNLFYFFTMSSYILDHIIQITLILPVYPLLVQVC